MKKRDKNLPEDADANRNPDDIQNKNQGEFDDRSRDLPNANRRKEESVRSKRIAEDSQTKHEDKIPPEKKKQPEKWDKVDRKLPNLKK